MLGSRGPDGYQWPIPYLSPFSSAVQLSWKRLAQFGHHNRIAPADSRVGLVAGVLASGNDLYKSRLGLCRGTTETLPEKDGSLPPLPSGRGKQGVPWLSQVFEEFPRLVVEPRKHLIQSVVPQVSVDSFAEDAAEICRQRQISSFVKL